MTPRRTIDLRSDTVTRPTPRMRRAMAEAEVGDDVYGEDPTVNRLERRSAELFGREAGLFVPSGSMGNLVSLLCLTRPGDEIICDRLSHVYNYELASHSAFGGVMPRVIDAPGGAPAWAAVAEAIRPAVYYVSPTTVLCLENTHNLAGGTALPAERTGELVERAHAAGLKVHLDGARIFNAAVATGETVEALTRGIDTVTFCFSKGLGAPVGSMIVGAREMIERARVFRKRLGGGMRQVGVLAAAALVALEDSPGRLHEDHANARWLAERLAELKGVRIDPARVATNMVFFDVVPQRMTAEEVEAALAEAGVLVSAAGPSTLRLVTHADVTREDVETAMRAMARLLG